jgi:plasmid stability protein
MAALQVRDLPDPIYQRLKVLAKQDHRSLAQEAIVVLARGLDMEESPQQRRRALLKTWRNRPAPTQTKVFSDPLKWIREDRDR